MDYVILKLKNVNKKHMEEITNLYLSNCENKMSFITKDRKILMKLFINSFDKNHYYICLHENKVIGMLYCSPHKGKGNMLDKKVLLKEFGFIKGNLKWLLIQFLLIEPYVKNNNETYIENIIIRNDYKENNIDNSLLIYIHNNTFYTKYKLNAFNDEDIKKYEKLGYIKLKIQKDFSYPFKNLTSFHMMEKDVDR